MMAFVFPGQGSQVVGMGRELFDSVPEYRRWESRVDEVLGCSMRELCCRDPHGLLGKTQFTQPALYVVNTLCYEQARSQGLSPSFVAGHSLGEYNALQAAGVFDFLTGLRLVKQRADLMASVGNGAMAAIVGLRVSQITDILERHGLSSLCVANMNTATQTVVSGSVYEIRRAQPIFEANGARLYLPLRVSAACHSPHMASVAAQFARSLDGFELSAPCLPVIANASAEPYEETGSLIAIKALLVRQIAEPVRWEQTIRLLIDRGVTEFRELGPGSVLQRMIDEIRRQIA